MSCNSCGRNTCVCEKRISSQGKRGPRGYQGGVGPTGPSGPSNLTIANTVFVAKNGNNTTGLVERLDKPFLTIAAARAAAVSAFPTRTETTRICVVVFTGYYQENIYLDKFIDYDLNDSIINGVVTDNRVDFGSTPTGCWTNIIYGTGKILNSHETGDSFNALGVLLGKNHTKLLMYCDTIQSDHDDAVGIENGQIRIHCNRITTNATGQNYFYAVECAQGFLDTDFSHSLVEVIGADITNSSGSTSSVTGFNEGGTDKNQTLSLINCRVKAQNAGSVDGGRSAVACGAVNPSNGKLNLYNTVLYSSAGKSIYVDTSDTLIVKYFHSNMANVTTGGGGTLTVSFGSLTVNAAVTAEF